jgi:hypothetical protein
MNLKHEFPESAERVVYVRPVVLAELPDEVRKEVGGDTGLYVVCSHQGERLALVRDRNVAFILARQNDLEPVNVH